MKKAVLFFSLIVAISCGTLYAPNVGLPLGSQISEGDFELGVLHSADNVFEECEAVAVPSGMLDDEHVPVLLGNDAPNPDLETFYIYGQIADIHDDGYSVYVGHNIYIECKSTATLGKL